MTSNKIVHDKLHTSLLGSNTLRGGLKQYNNGVLLANWFESRLDPWEKQSCQAHLEPAPLRTRMTDYDSIYRLSFQTGNFEKRPYDCSRSWYAYQEYKPSMWDTEHRSVYRHYARLPPYATEEEPNLQEQRPEACELREQRPEACELREQRPEVCELREQRPEACELREQRPEACELREQRPEACQLHDNAEQDIYLPLKGILKYDCQTQDESGGCKHSN